MDKISVVGSTSYIGGKFLDTFPNETCRVPSRSLDIPTNNLLFLRSTVDNYNIWDNPKLDPSICIMHLIDTLEACKAKFSNNFTVNLVSSWFIYGKQDELPVKETAICNPLGWYATAKYSSEIFLRSYCITYDIPYRILRLSNIYGGYDSGANKKKNALHHLAKQIYNNINIDLYYGGNFIRDYLHINDCCTAIKTIIDNGCWNTIYNVGSGNGIVFLQAMDALKEQ